VDKRLSRIVLILTVIVITKFWIGVYEDDEFYEEHVFFKHRAIWKTYFYSPRGMSDLNISEMSSEQQKEQKLFDEFIIENHYSN